MLGYNLCEEIEYSMVPAVSMRRNRPVFEKLDGERFEQYLKDVKGGKAKIAATALKPHELVRELLKLDEDVDDWYFKYSEDEKLSECVESPSVWSPEGPFFLSPDDGPFIVSPEGPPLIQVPRGRFFYLAS